MLAARAVRQSAEEPLSGLEVADGPPGAVPEGWVRVRVRTAALNHHDLWSLRGAGLPAKLLPMVLGCDAAGVTDDGREVLVHAVVSSDDWRGDETLDPGRTLLSELHPGTLAEEVFVPARNLVAKPASWTFERAASLGTAWLTAYRMLFTQAQATPGQTVLVQGAAGGVSSALVALGSAAGLRMWVTGRDPERVEQAVAWGADRGFAAGERLPEKVDAVMESVGKATWQHSVRALRPGGTIVVCGATTGGDAPAQLEHVFFRQLRVLGSTMGTLEEFQRMVRFCELRDLAPAVDSVHPLPEARAAFERLESGQARGKVVVTV
ncbi:NADPH:quinone reductase-like Zn-dependent oxidoreductase [Kineococcus xinjiangensis]|uniref:NADPH:quinone reductase-like Zn-dependent oxidoreductase n=1 Tax=Kineococcus xinjiangensis TaxID=512762 RepID=A0A2S6IJ17_9ACTN|nr:zinc-binding dehydrogenase [Kineococcus xinjiangensis]PPK94213.1 NADPH:quinone reductase-like Zn-dependent oxidoreductase [Kineococcus xinjiangensis]